MKAFDFTVVSRSTIYAKSGGPRIQGPDPADPSKVAGVADSYYLGASAARGTVSGGDHSIQMHGGDTDPAAAVDLGKLTPTLAGLVTGGKSWRNDGKGWYESDQLPGIGLDPRTVSLLPTLLKHATHAAAGAPTALGGLQLPTVRADAAVADAPGLMAPDAAPFTELAQPLQFAFDARYAFTNPMVNGSTTTYTRPGALYANLVRSGTTSFTLTYRDQSADTFTVSGSEGLLSREQDRFGNGVTLAYVAGTNRISTITDTAASPNRTINLSYDGSSRLTSITDWAYVSGGVVQTGATGSHRVYRFFYDATSDLIGWADPLDTTDSCPAATVASNVTCLADASGRLAAVTKNLTHLQPSGGVRPAISVPYDSGNVTTSVAYAASDVSAVTDADGGATAFTHPGVGQTQVVRPGTPASTTVYTLASPGDAYGRVTSVKRRLNLTWVEERTAYDAAFPIEPDSVTEDYIDGTPSDSSPDQDVTTSYTYAAGSMGLVSRVTEPLTATTHRTTDYTYNANSDVTQRVVALDGSGTTRTVTRHCYDASCTLAGSGLLMLAQVDDYVDGTPGNGLANSEDVKTAFQHDAYGQLTLETRYNYNAAGTLLDQRATGHAYDDRGNATSDVVNYADGDVSSGGDDVTPNATTGARTDLTTAYGYDTAGDRVSTADPRRAIATALGQIPGQHDYLTTSTYDALGEQLSELSPTTPGQPSTQAAQSWTYNELGGQVEHIDYGGVYTASTTNRRGLVTGTWQDPDYTGPAPIRQESATAYDASGRQTASEDGRQVADPTLGQTSTAYDELGRATDVTEAAPQPGQPTPDASSTTHTTYDALGRTTGSTTGYLSADAQTTTTAFDLGGRALRTDDEFTCATTAYDYRGLATQTVTGYLTGCTGGTPLTTTTTSDGLGRVTQRNVDASNAPESNTYDSAGNKLATSAKQGGTTTGTSYTLNPLDQVLASATSDGSTTKTSFDATGNATDTCYWKPGATVGSCLPADTGSWTNPPTQSSTVLSDARDQRIALTTRLGSTSTVATTTYDPAHNYQISAFYLPTAAGKEAQDLYAYDARHRLATVVHQLCTISAGHACLSANPTGSSTYAYDDNDNRTTVTESSTGGAPTTRNYCYDARDQLAAERAGAACTLTTGEEVNAYDPTGDRTSATVSGSTRSFAYGADGMGHDGQLLSCSNPSCAVSYDAEGRMQTVTDTNGTWTFAYDADGKMTSACAGTTCSGSGFNRVDYTYDGDGHRTEVKEVTAGGVVTTTDLRYAGDAVVQESVNGTVTRTYATDDSGKAVEVCDPDCATGTVYVVAWNGHGDATGLWRKNGDGTLTLANSYAYGTWGTPTTTVASGFTDLRFRFLYVGASDVQWDDSFGLHL